MTRTLREYGRILAEVTGLSPEAIYERQRGLQAGGLITSPGTRGPGAGVQATPENAALLLGAVLAGEAKVHTADAVRRLFALVPEPNIPFPMRVPEYENFGRALVDAFANPAEKKVEIIRLYRHLPTAQIGYADGRVMQFIGTGHPIAGMSNVVELDGRQIDRLTWVMR